MPPKMAPSPKALIPWSEAIRDAVQKHCDEAGIGVAEFTRELWCRELGKLNLLETMPKRGRQPKAPAKKKPKK